MQTVYDQGPFERLADMHLPADAKGKWNDVATTLPQSGLSVTSVRKASLPPGTPPSPAARMHRETRSRACTLLANTLPQFVMSVTAPGKFFLPSLCPSLRLSVFYRLFPG